VQSLGPEGVLKANFTIKKPERAHRYYLPPKGKALLQRLLLH
jgi:hypothetical protein